MDWHLHECFYNHPKKHYQGCLVIILELKMFLKKKEVINTHINEVTLEVNYENLNAKQTTATLLTSDTG